MHLVKDLATAYDKSKIHPADLTTKKYGQDSKELLKACSDREILLMKRNSFVYLVKIFQLTIMAFVTLTVFFWTEKPRDNQEDGTIYLGVVLFGVTMIMFNGMSKISMTIAKLPVFYKQRNFLFFPAWLYALPTWIIRISISFLEVFVWTVLTYYVIGFDPNVGRLFKQMLLLFLVNQMASTLFWFIGVIGRNMIIASTFGAFALLVFFTLGGFVLSRNDVKSWWIWGYWTSPLMYTMNGMVVNEFLGHKWTTALNATTLGKVAISSRGFFPYAYWYWIAVGSLVGFILIFILLLSSRYFMKKIKWDI